MDLTPNLKLDWEENCDKFSTPLSHILVRKRKHHETFDSCCTPSPKFSSTCNESLIQNFNEFALESPQPNTPEKQLKLISESLESPVIESRRILYSSIKTVKPDRKLQCSKIIKFVPAGNWNLLRQILSINVIMDVIFKKLSGGDLYRFSLVCQSFYEALERNSEAFERYMAYKSVHRDNKENYVITPPGSPDKPGSPPRTNSEVFNKFLRTARQLTASQSLTKCRKCKSVAVVDNKITQCQNVNFCGLIYCQLCSSYSETGPKDFTDKCGNAILRPKLGNVSNCMDESFYVNYSSQDSGFYSENESPVKVRRNLFQTPPKTKAFAANNSLRQIVYPKKKEKLFLVPVVANTERVSSTAVGDSPPRGGGYAVGSKQSKRNLKRLTR